MKDKKGEDFTIKRARLRQGHSLWSLSFIPVFPRKCTAEAREVTNKAIKPGHSTSFTILPVRVLGLGVPNHDTCQTSTVIVPFSRGLAIHYSIISTESVADKLERQLVPKKKHEPKFKECGPLSPVKG